MNANVRRDNGDVTFRLQSWNWHPLISRFASYSTINLQIPDYITKVCFWCSLRASVVLVLCFLLIALETASRLFNKCLYI
ncbi:hypothetical protein IQ06DRAFT_33814 [Phaeosphaeriaceae sp. SRC1lsM3a]|nr:hypothetical protein IQ06DRAFT_33814 [Stagonospora sp. SRC1lsM3a]